MGICCFFWWGTCWQAGTCWSWQAGLYGRRFRNSPKNPMKDHGHRPTLHLHFSGHLDQWKPRDTSCISKISCSCASFRSLYIQTPPEKVFWPQNHTLNTFSEGIWMSRGLEDPAMFFSFCLGWGMGLGGWIFKAVQGIVVWHVSVHSRKIKSQPKSGWPFVCQ